MNWLKKFFIVFLSFLPLSASALAPFLIGTAIGDAGIAGFSIYRSMAPVNLNDAFNFFSSCWSCQLFSDIMSAMSSLLPKAYNAISEVIIPFAIILSVVWFAWTLFSGYINAKVEEPWGITSKFTTHLIKLSFISALLLLPLPRMLNDVVIEPIFNVGLYLNRAFVTDDSFANCVVATAIADPVSISDTAASSGAFSPRLRHNLACELSNIHQITALGMTVGWTMLNMSFNDEYMYKILWDIPIFPNVFVFFAGVLILGLFIYALLPIPLYFLEIFITLSLDLIMLPFMLLSWLFKGWAIFPNGGKTIQGMINDVIKGTVGIALTGVFLILAVMFLNAIFTDWNGVNFLQQAFENNDSSILMDGLMLRNDSIVTILMMGVFIAMFMTMIPSLVKTIFNVEISQRFYEKAKKDLNTLWSGAQKWYKSLKK